MSKEERQRVFDKCGGKCAYCGTVLKGRFQVDHIIPQGSFEMHVKNKFKVPEFLAHLTCEDCDHIDNLLPTCQSCNNYKRDNNLELFRSEITELVTRLNKRFAQYKIAKRFGLVAETNSPVIFYFETLDSI